MESTLFSAGLACLIGAVVGGGLKALGFEFPVLTVRRQILLGVLGICLLAFSQAKYLSELWSQSPPPTEKNTDLFDLSGVWRSGMDVSHKDFYEEITIHQHDDSYLVYFTAAVNKKTGQRTMACLDKDCAETADLFGYWPKFEDAVLILKPISGKFGEAASERAWVGLLRPQHWPYESKEAEAACKLAIEEYVKSPSRLLVRISGGQRPQISLGSFWPAVFYQRSNGCDRGSTQYSGWTFTRYERDNKE